MRLRISAAVLFPYCPSMPFLFRASTTRRSGSRSAWIFAPWCAMKDENRITLSHRELLGTWTENAERFRVGETVAGIVRSVESYGIFVELTPNLAGLAELKENVHAGQQASVFIKSILPNRMKVKLVLVECFDYTYKPEPPVYFFQGDHIDKFTYSPPECAKHIETVFA